jgi:hypothetical protein
MMGIRVAASIVATSLMIVVVVHSDARPASAQARTAGDKAVTKVLTVDIGGTSVKIPATGQVEPRSFPSGPTMTPGQMVTGVKSLAKDWVYEAVSLGGFSLW